MKRTFLVSFCEGLSVLIQFIYFILWGYFFGAASSMDAFWAAMTIPVVLIAVLSEPVISTVVPFLLKTQAQKPDTSINEIKNNLFNSLIFIGLGLTLVMFLLAPVVIKLITPGFNLDSLEAASSLLKVLLISLPFKMGAAALTGFYYAEDRYILPTLLPAFGTISAIVFLILYQQNLGVFALAWGTVLGSVVQLVFGLPILRNYSFPPKLRRLGLSNLGKQVLPLLAGNSYYKSDIVVDRYIASYLPAGSISYLGYGHRVVIVLNQIIVRGLITTRFREMSKNSLEGRKHLQRTVNDLFSKTMYTGIPLVTYLIIFTRPELQLILSTSALSTNDINNISLTVFAYTGMILFGLFGSVLANTFYCINDTRTITKIGVMSFTAGIGLKILGVKLFSYLGVAGATSLYFLIALIMEIAFLQYKIKLLDLTRLFLKLLKHTFAALITLLTVLVLKAALPSGGFMFVLMGTGLFIIVYFMITYMINIPESRSIFNRVCRAINRDKAGRQQ